MVDIREANPADAPVLDAMVRELAAHEGSLEHVRVGVEGWRALLARPDVTVLIAEADGEVIGFTSTVRRLHLWSGSDLLALDDLYVRPGHRDKGVGSQLMSAVARLAARDDLLVLWGVRLDNHSGQRFYARLGATLSTKMSASWTPERYRHHLATTAR
jgi:GNAT superfamily N-acetyltransferase